MTCTGALLAAAALDVDLALGASLTRGTPHTVRAHTALADRFSNINLDGWVLLLNAHAGDALRRYSNPRNGWQYHALPTRIDTCTTDSVRPNICRSPQLLPSLANLPEVVAATDSRSLDLLRIQSSFGPVAHIPFLRFSIVHKLGRFSRVGPLAARVRLWSPSPPGPAAVAPRSCP